MRKRRIKKWERDIENRRKIQKEEEILKISYLLFQNSYLLSQIEIPEQLSIPSAIYMDQPLDTIPGGWASAPNAMLLILIIENC